ncbi:MAG: NUMOD4 motif-containing HNH endonuclease, partial [Gelidibacter sp.]|nr:NUMOD4 motif-containing HNH endonuclease [Gelidibacter sp.]
MKTATQTKYYTPEIEIWKEVVGYEKEYEVSNLGNVRRKPKNLKQSISPHGYKTLTLSKNGKCSTKLVHRLVAESFIENPKVNEQVNHKDCNKINNTLSNLEWVTFKENIEHAVENNRQRNQTGENNNMSKLLKEEVLMIKELLKEGVTAYKIHKEFFPHLHSQTIYAIKQGRLWKEV